MNEQREKLSLLAKDILKLDRNTLTVNLRFMDMALNQLIPVEHEILPLATDGTHLVYNPIRVLRMFKRDKEASARAYLHVVFHCVYRHMYIHTLLERDLWDLACDIAVEKTINDLDIRETNTKDGSRQISVLDQLEADLKVITAEKVYYYYLTKRPSEKRYKELQELFQADDHSLWYMNEDEKNDALGLCDRQSESDSSGDSSDAEGNSPTSSMAEMESLWKDVSEHMQMDLETFSKERGDQAGSLIQNLRELNREKYDYESFLRKFAVRGEVMKLDLDEFDYIFYTYGLKLYGNVPLIEPLEYKDVKRIKEFVIAIDTSGSTSGPLVQAFLQKTYNILKSTESFFTKINVHIIQCDTMIQEDAKITSQEEFDAYLKTMQIRGLGGTDFQPVFNYVDKLVANQEFQNLKGLIYFTDGWGFFPRHAPSYETAFVFIEDPYNNYDVPSWAIKLILKSEDIKKFYPDMFQGYFGY